jgi:hypothetical protein
MGCATTLHCGDRDQLVLKQFKTAKGSHMLTVKGKYCLNPPSNSGQEHTKVAGYVIDRRTGEFLSALVNVVATTTISTTSNEQGYFELVVLPGAFRVKVIHPGNAPLTTKPLHAPDNSRTEMVFYLGTTIIR